MGRRLLLLLLFVASARTALADEPDWQTLTQQAAQLLSRYVQIDTTNPPGNELAAAKFLKSTLPGGLVVSICT